MTTNGSSTLEIKASLLSKGINFDIDLFVRYKEKSKKDYYENTYGYCHTNKDILRKHRFPQVLCLGDDIVVSCLRRENTPWNLRLDGDELNLYHNNDYKRTLNLPEALPFFGKTLSDGTLSDDIISVSGAVTPGGATRFCEVQKFCNISYLGIERSLPRKGKNREVRPGFIRNQPW